MKRIFLTATLLFSTIMSVLAQNTGIVFFKGTFDQAVEKARAENKLIFMDCMASWCGPCKHLATEEFTKPEMGSYFNAHFINLSVDMEDNAEGKTLRKRFDVDYYPTLLLINPKGYKTKEIIAGGKKADFLIQWAAAGLKAKDTITLQQQFGEGNRDADFLKTYFKELLDQHNERRIETSLTQMIKEKGYNILYTKPCFNVIDVLNINSPIATYFFINNTSFSDKLGKDAVAQKIANMFNSMNYYTVFFGPGPIREYKAKEYDDLKIRLKAYNLPYSNFIFSEIDFILNSLRFRDQQKSFLALQEMLINANAWQFHDVAKLANKYLYGEVRQKAARWAKIAAEKNNDNIFLKSQCNTYYTELSTLPSAKIADRAYPYQVSVNLD